MSYVNTKSVLGTAVTFTVTSVAAVGARFAIRIHSRTGVGADDWLALCAMVCVLGACGLCIAGALTDTIGGHSPKPDGPLAEFWTEVNPKQQLFKKLEFGFYALHTPALTFLKLSVLMLYRRIFRVQKAFNICFWILSAFSMTWGIAFLVSWASLCGDHFSNFWYNMKTLETKCGDTFAVIICQAVFDVTVDLAILILPIPFVLQLNMSTERKLGVLGVLLVGSLAIACGIARMIIVGMVLTTDMFLFDTVAGEKTWDVIGIVSLMVFWGLLEIGVAMLAVCLPSLRPLLGGEAMQNLSRKIRSFMSLNDSSNSASGPRSRTRRNMKLPSDDSIPLGEREAIEVNVEFSVNSFSRDDERSDEKASYLEFTKRV